MLGTAAHEAGFRAVVDDRDAACGEQPVVGVDETGIGRIQSRHVVVVVEAHQLVRIGIRAVEQMQRFGQRLEAFLLLAEGRRQRTTQREIQHADVGVGRPGVLGNLAGVVVERFAEHEHARVLRADALDEFMPPRMRQPANGVDAQCIHALRGPLQIGAGEVVHHRRVVFVEVGQLGQVAVEDRPLAAVHRADVVVEGVQRVVLRVELVRRQVLVVGDELAVLVEDLAELRLLVWHRPCGRAVVADDIQHHLQTGIV
ncbi:hypothetical protein D3C71_1461000 [compost metagenome]